MPQKVTINRLTLSAFRNYDHASLNLDGRHVVLTGENGAGKTNLLEAISFFSPGRGLRRAVYADVGKQGADAGFSIFAEVDGMDGTVEIGTGLLPGSETASRRVRINATDAKSADELLDHLRILWLTPAMDGLFTGGASDRRRFIDRLVLSLDPTHGRRASDFERSMKMRNKLLEEGRYDADWIGAIEKQMAGLGVAMKMARSELVSLLAHLADRDGSGSAFPSADLSLTGFLDGMEGLPALDLEDQYIELLQQGRYRDQAAGRTLEGPHRTDLNVLHRDKKIEAGLCSTGEQKALLTGLVLAHAQLTANLTGAAPILLLDEIAAHFDMRRRASLFDLIDQLGGQAFMTGTDRHLFEALGERALQLTVSNGSINVSS
ncbi:DNA replication/repair protein RecF [Rhizobium sp. KVB221]|uniref:DNA replication and repair protein RecF n=1 Tax=Rhizobium setariae TaxID=2801340 RepID=A0A936YND6_9HYPH|nr:DNA replication/repair protein RecF [Rhizobium setariae]MBL0372678.1 DNA replication/repair protein RecF [Rhizobium setariae]